MGGGTQGCAERPVLHANPLGVHALRTGKAERRAPRADAAGWSLNLDYCLVAVVLCVGPDVQTDGGDAASVLLLLDYWPLGRARGDDGAAHGRAGVKRRWRTSCCWRNCPCSDWHSHRVAVTMLAQHEAIRPFEKSFCPCAWACLDSPMWLIWGRCSGRQVWRSYTAYLGKHWGCSGAAVPGSAGCISAGVLCCVVATPIF